MCTPMDLVLVPQPHFIPGYTGYCPQYKFRSGNTYGICTHKVLVDPTINHSEYLVLSDRSTDEYQVYRPCQRDIDLVKARTMHGGEVYQHPMVPGYEGFVPRANNQFGQSYSVSATEALSEFERQQVNNRRALQYMKVLGSAQNDAWDPKSLQDKTLIKTDYKLPLMAVRPDRVAVIRDKKVIEAAIEPPIQSLSPYFMDNNNPQKRIKKGTATNIPFGYSKFGGSNDLMTNSALCDFTSNYRKRLSSEWAPVNLSRPDPPLHFQPMEIYHKHTGQVPNYGGHIPGAIFRYHKFITAVNGKEFTGYGLFVFSDVEKHSAKILGMLKDGSEEILGFKVRGFSGHETYGYSHDQGVKVPTINNVKNELLTTYRQRRATEWQPQAISEHPRPYETMTYKIYHTHVGLLPNYSGHIPGAKFRFGRTFGQDTLDAKRWLRGNHRPN